MKLIVCNTYIKVFKFYSSQEVVTFISNLGTIKHLNIDTIFGDYFYCYVGYHSLTSEKQFVLSFCSDEIDDNLSCLYWDNLLVLHTGENVYLIDEQLNIKTSLEITTPLIGLYLINKEKLLLLEEAFIRVINYNGDIVKSVLVDLIEDFDIKDDVLSIQTSSNNTVIKLTQ